MTIRMALKHIRKLAPETEKTFQAIVRRADACGRERREANVR